MEQEYAAIYADLYHNHWWWRAREAILLQLLSQLDLPTPCRILDVGCGDGLFFPALGQFGDVKGIETDESLISPDGLYRDCIFTKPLGDPIYDEMEFDLITALDVIEHIEDDRNAVAQMAKLLAPSAKLVVTVPAFMALWDQHDEMNKHFRRYSRRTLKEALQDYGTIRECRYLFHTIFFPKLCIKFINRFRSNKLRQHGIPAASLNRLSSKWCILEFQWLRRVPVPFGTSVLAVLQRNR